MPSWYTLNFFCLQIGYTSVSFLDALVLLSETFFTYLCHRYLGLIIAF